MIDHISKKFNQGLAASSQRGFFQLFIVGGTQTIEEAQDTLHKFLSVVREGCQHRAFDEFQGIRVLELIDGLGCCRSFNQLESL